LGNHILDHCHHRCGTGLRWYRGTATGIAKILFVVFLVMFVVSFFMGRRGRG
jgi:uncharacterized membrane protein YtjA (UPF0391 family)